MAAFVGRRRELDRLRAELDRVRAGGTEAGRCLLVHGRRRVGKSRLVEQFLHQASAPSLFFTASRHPDGPRLFVADLAASDLPDAADFADVEPGDWDGALRLLARAVPDDQPSVVVIDEFPYLVERDEGVESTFQKHWDRSLKKKPVLLILVGSDIAVMDQLNAYGRGFHQRGTPFAVGPLSPAEVAEIVQPERAIDAFDAYLVTGGLPLICEDWSPGEPLWEHLERVLADPSSALVVSAQLSLAAELPADTHARTVLEQIGHGETTFTKIAQRAGGITHAMLERSLTTMIGRRVVARDLPLSTRSLREPRYRVADPYLRFWLRYLGPNAAKLDRGRSDLVLAELRASFGAWRGKAIEPVVREALGSAALAARLPGDASEVGGYWTRRNVPEIDLVGADRPTPAEAIAWVGTVKWREREPVTEAELRKLAADAALVPGVDASTPLVAVCPAGVEAPGATALTADDLLDAWQP